MELERLALPRPHTVFPARGKLPARSELAGYFVKPRDSFAFQALFQVKGFRFQTAAEAEQVLSVCEERGVEVILQELIPGPATAHYFLDDSVNRHGTLCALFARRRLRAQYGELSGSSCLVSIEPGLMDQAAEDLQRLLTAIGYRGIFSAEFKFDHRDGQFKMIEVNTRVWGDMGLAMRCGVDVVQMAYRDALGEDVWPVSGYAVGQHWVSLLRDRVVAMGQFRAGKLSWGAFARSWAGAEFDCWSLADPMPAVWEAGQRLRRRVKRIGQSNRLPNRREPLVRTATP